MDHDHSAWEHVVQEALTRAAPRQQRLVELLGEDVQYHWDLKQAAITWSRAGTVVWTARLTLIGTVSLAESSWLWSWANDSLPAAAAGDTHLVREYGEKHGFPVLPWPGFNHHPDLVKEARVVSAAVLDADALWTDQSGDMQLHFLLHDLTGS
ncbi:hypothetical protein EV646_103401 [Kribbella antiqua]|uniref:Uncharacterized protein n=1 Tax=Kribbella antiqua TaxID=2512217 RepID=A0A4R2IV32_9ACTN|nr:DUF6882 domain-containing protein [Kribbella antiqua]TCO49423.1 hypothetical protein EV646_103401 [Kribbella antiqua]